MACIHRRPTILAESGQHIIIQHVKNSLAKCINIPTMAINRDNRQANDEKSQFFPSRKEY